MVVSKDSKRKRKESSPPPTPQQQQQQRQQQQPPTQQQQQSSNAAVESSPEMPKRTKVQAQRKFAQGQSAPQSSYNSQAAAAASSSSNAGPSTSSECREPPTELLPNKRPKTEDFLTFLCFRGTDDLPPHLDFLNQGKSKEPAKPTKKTTKPPPKKKGKKGRPPKNQKSPAVAPTQQQKNIKPSEESPTGKDKPLKASENKSPKSRKRELEPEEEDTPSYPVRKRAEVIADGNRRSNRNLAEDKCNNITDVVQRRSSRATKGSKPMVDHHSDEEEDEFLSALDETSKTVNSDADGKDPKSAKALSQAERKSESPSKESEATAKSRKGRPSSTTRKPEVENDVGKAEAKEKQPAKRSRQKESPIFIPSPEPSGRMTRQRAFFEPVKVPPKEDEAQDVAAAESKKDAESNDSGAKGDENVVAIADADASKKPSVSKRAQSVENHANISQLNVFDFSSDDEQPLAKTIKLKKTTATKPAPKKANQRAAKKNVLQKDNPEEDVVESKDEDKQIEDTSKKETKKPATATDEDPNKSKGKRPGTAATTPKTSKKTIAEEADEAETAKDLSPPLSKKPANARQSRRKVKPEEPEQAKPELVANESSSSPTRNQRPSRKTKEAATIYMGIIGHRLQLAEDEDDDISLSSFDRPNVREMEKMENELKRNSNAGSKDNCTTSPPSKLNKQSVASVSPPPSLATPTSPEKPAAARRGRPPKNAKVTPQSKLEEEGSLVKKNIVAKTNQSSENVADTKDSKTEPSKAGTEEDEDDTKDKLERSFSDSDDEPLAIKAHVKANDRDVGDQLHKEPQHVVSLPQNTETTEAVADSIVPLPPETAPPLAEKSAADAVRTTPPPASNNVVSNTNTTPTLGLGEAVPSPTAASALPVPTTPTSQSPFKSIEKKSPVPTSKILNVPATYGGPPVSPCTNVPSNGANAAFGKSSMYVPQSPAHYHAQHPSQQHVRPPAPNIPQFPVQSPGKLPAVGSPLPISTAAVAAHMTTPPSPMTAQSSMKYQTPPTTYPPPIEAYPLPKINPNFLTPKFDRNTLARPGVPGGNSNSFPSPSPVKFDMSGSSSGLMKNSSMPGANIPMSPKTLLAGNANYVNNNAGAAPSGGGQLSNDPLKDEIGSILAANLMPSKEESGKIFGIASVSLAQSSGPDNTKCTLGKCGSVHKPVLGPVVPTESYIGDQLSGKERRKAKVNMTHEQIHKWLIECSSNPDEIQDDLDDDFDSDLRPNNFSSTPPPIRDDKESTSFSSSSKATRDLGKSESAWSAKGPSLKANPVVASNNATANNRKDEQKASEPTSPQDDDFEKNSPAINAVFDKQITNKQSPAPGSTDEKLTQSEKSDRNTAGKVNAAKEDKSADKCADADLNPTKVSDKGEQGSKVTTPVQKQACQKSVSQKKTTSSPVTTPTTHTATSKQGRKKQQVEDVDNKADKPSSKVAETAADNDNANAVNKTPKRTPVYQQKQTPKQQAASSSEVKAATTSGQKRAAAASYGAAFSVENEKSIYSFDKDDDDDDNVPEKSQKPSTYRRQNRRDSNTDNGVNTTSSTSQRSPPTKPKRNAAAVAEIANKELAGGNSQTSSVSLTLSPSEKSKLVKVSLDAEGKPASKPAKGAKGAKKSNVEQAKPKANDPESDSGDGNTFYIPLQGLGSGGVGEAGIQGVAVKLGREGPDGPNQKVIMHATLVTKAQMRSNSKPLPESMNVSDIVKNLMAGEKKTTCPAAGPSTSAAAAANSSANSLKNVPVGTVQPRFKGDAAVNQGPSTSAAGGGGGGALQRVNSNSSLFSGSVKSRNAAGGPSGAVAAAHLTNKKFKDDTPIKMSNNTAFPRHDDPTQMVEAPIFRPSEKEFSDPIEFIERITPIAARFGICKIIPPTNFKPECRIADEMRFTAYNQYVHKLLHRWGPSAKELSAIKKYLATQSIVMNHPPWIGGMEVDLPRLYHTVQELGGLKEVIEKKKWARVAEEMCIPKLAQDRVTKLDDIYCKYLLPYDTLSPAERQKLFDEVEADWAKREARARRNADRFVNTESVSNEDDDVSSENDEDESEEEVDGVSMECIVKGRSMPLSQFYRIARNTMALWFKNTEPTVTEVEAEFWRHVAVRDSHVCVHSGSIDSSGWGFGFPSPGPKGKGSNYARHPWNLKVLTNNPGSVLRSLGPVMGVTVPTLHVGMLFSACCWYRDPHGLSWIEYLHTGASKLWYGIPDDQSANFRAALTSLIPTHCQNKTIWLPCDTVMVPPHMLTDRGVSLCRIEQKPGEFIVVFPRAYTSSLATGYVVSESVYFATSSWLDLAKDDFRDIHDSCEPAMFSLEQLLFALGYDQRVTPDALQQMLPMLQEVFEKESAAREQLKATGVTSTEKVTTEKGGKAKKQQPPHKSIESECDLCRANLYISMIRTDEGNVYCLQHALKNLNNGNIQAKQCKLIYAYNIEDIEGLIKALKDKIQQKRTAAGKKQK